MLTKQKNTRIPKKEQVLQTLVSGTLISSVRTRCSTAKLTAKYDEYILNLNFVRHAKH